MSEVFSTLIIAFENNSTAKKVTSFFDELKNEAYKTVDENFKTLGIKATFSKSRPAVEFTSLNENVLTIHSNVEKFNTFPPSFLNSLPETLAIYLREFDLEDTLLNKLLVFQLLLINRVESLVLEDKPKEIGKYLELLRRSQVRLNKMDVPEKWVGLLKGSAEKLIMASSRHLISG